MRVEPNLINNTQVCTRCGIEKPFSEFSKTPPSYSTSKYPLLPFCRMCNNSAARRSRSNNPDMYRKHGRKKRLKKEYNLSLEDYNKMAINQDWKCAICRKDPIENQIIHGLVVDHCHLSGMVRGLLCTNCNLGIGYLMDNAELTYRAFEYLSSWDNESNLRRYDES